MLYINEIEKVLEQKHPFLLVDRVLEYKEGEYAIGYKNISYAEFWTSGHFAGNPIYPGSLIIESCAQVGAFIFCKQVEDQKKLKGMLSGVSKFKFITPVIPGDQLMIRADIIESAFQMAKVKVKVTVAEKRVAEGELSYVFME